MLNNVGLKGHPYLTPFWYGNFGDSPNMVLTVHSFSLYSSLIDSNMFPRIPCYSKAYIKAI